QTSGPASDVSVGLSPSSIVANGTSQSTATATVTDAEGHPIAGDHVGFGACDSGEEIGPERESGEEGYSATLTSSTTVHSVTVTATDSSVSPHVSGEGTLTQTVGPASSVSVGLSPSSIVADGTSQSTATATVTDAEGHPIAGDHVGFGSSDSAEAIG